MAGIPLHPNILTKLRESRRVSKEDAAKALRLDVVSFTKLESGEKEPGVTQLRRLASLYSYPLEVFAWKEVPEGYGSIVDFRTVAMSEARLTKKLTEVIDEADFLRSRVSRLTRADLDVGNFSLTLKDNPEERAGALRFKFGLTAEIQKSFKSHAAMFNWLRKKVEGFGALVLRMNFGSTRARGLALVGGGKNPAIVINSNDVWEGASSFSLMHELAHVLLNRPGISGSSINNNVERFCNEFAACFLMPEVEFKNISYKEAWNKDELQRLADKFKVSKLAVAYRIERIGRAPKGFYLSIRRTGGDIPEKDEFPDNVPRSIIDVNRLGFLVCESVLNAVDSGRINKIDAYRILRISPSRFDAIRQELDGRADRARKIGGGDE